jgi:hypothetical protein
MKNRKTDQIFPPNFQTTCYHRHFGFISLIQSFFISTTTLESENGKNMNEILNKFRNFKGY